MPFTWSGSRSVIRTISFMVLISGNKTILSINWNVRILTKHAKNLRKVFNWVSRGIWNCFGFASLWSLFGFEKLHSQLTRRKTKTQPQLRHFVFSHGSKIFFPFLWVLHNWFLMTINWNVPYIYLFKFNSIITLFINLNINFFYFIA